ESCPGGNNCDHEKCDRGAAKGALDRLALTPCAWERGRLASSSLASFQRRPGPWSAIRSCQQRQLGAVLTKAGRRERSSSIQFFRWPVPQVASLATCLRDECSSGASALARGQLDRKRSGR